MKFRIIQPLLMIGISALLVCCHEEQIAPETPSEEQTTEDVPAPEHQSDSSEIQEPPVTVDSLDHTDSLSNVDTTNAPNPVPDFDDKYEYHAFEQLPYRLLLPRNYSPSKKYPLLIFLHGKGERGNDNEKQLTYGASLFQADSIRSKYPAIIVFPQCPVDYYWFDDWAIAKLGKLINNLRQEYSVDDSQILAGGLSMGAYGVFALVPKYPDLFKRVVAIAGDGDDRLAKKMKKPKWRIFAGERDEIVASSKTKGMAKALEKAGASVSLTVYPQADHLNSWLNAFAEPDFCKWLFSE